MDKLIKEKMVDEISLIYFNARKVYQRNQRLSTFYSNIRKLPVTYSFREIEEHIAKYGTKEWVIIGNDDSALYNYLVLSDSTYNITGVFPGDGMFTAVNVQKIDRDQLLDWSVGENCAVVVCEKDIVKYADLLVGLNNSNKFVVQNHVVGRCGIQYFDYFTASDVEVFVDGGSLDGKTTDSFIEWCEGRYECVYAFEPNPQMVEICRTHFCENEKVHFYDYALWNEKANLSFDNSGSKWDAHISQEGTIQVMADTIDNVIGDKLITFIKLDVEGSELETLQGAKRCIQKNIPKLAISIYHKLEDMEKICMFLLDLVPEYKFAIRHYHSDAIETILYAFKE